MWYREETEDTHYALVSFPRDYLVVVGHTPQEHINFQELRGNPNNPMVFCDCGKGDLKGFNLTKLEEETIENTNYEQQTKYDCQEFEKTKMFFRMINYTFHSIEKSAVERRIPSQEDIDIILQNQDMLTKDQKCQLEKILPILNQLSSAKQKEGIRIDYKLENFQSQDSRSVQEIPNKDQKCSLNQLVVQSSSEKPEYPNGR